MRLFIAAFAVASLLPGIAAAQQNTKPTHSGRGGQSVIGAGTGANRTPGDHTLRGNNGQQGNKQGGGPQQQQGKTQQ